MGGNISRIGVKAKQSYKVKRRLIGNRGLYFVVCGHTDMIMNSEPLRQREAESYAKVLNEEYFKLNFG